MCILLAAYQVHPRYRLVIAANRDEFHERPTAPLAFWSDQPRILAGRDLEQGGTWLGVDRRGRFGAVTNVRGGSIASPRRSRGLLISEFLRGDDEPDRHVERLQADARHYDGFNLLLASDNQLLWWSNQAPAPRALPAGTYGLSNDSLDTPWPKVASLKTQFTQFKHLEEDLLIDALLGVLQDGRLPLDAELPDTGVGLAAERLLGSIFIAAAHYGTRCSSVVLLDHSGAISFAERRYGPNGRLAGNSLFRFDREAVDPVHNYGSQPR